MTDAVKRVLVAGYGVMGRGIMLSFLGGGFETTVLTRDPSRITDLPAGGRAVKDLPDEPPDLVIETIPEVRDLKLDLYRRLEEAYGGVPIVASNTSGLPLQELAADLRHPHRFLGVHYMQPAEAFPLVEVIRVAETGDAALAHTVAALDRTGKTAIVLNRPVVGFLFNRLQHAILHEAYWMIEQGIVRPQDVDAFARHVFGPRMCVTGLIEQKDLAGLDTHALAQRSIVPALHHGAEPNPIVQGMYERGDLGVKTGRGFYDWGGRDVGARRRLAADKLARILAIIEEDEGEAGGTPRGISGP